MKEMGGGQNFRKRDVKLRNAWPTERVWGIGEKKTGPDLTTWENCCPGLVLFCFCNQKSPRAGPARAIGGQREVNGKGKTQKGKSNR